MTARDEVLSRVRRALSGAPAAPAVSRSYRDARGPAGEELLALFAERVSDYRATVVRCVEHDVTAHIASALDGARPVVPADLPWEVAGSVPDAGLTSADLDATAAVVTAAAVGIAVTGTIVLDHGPGQGRRALSLIPDLHVCIVRAGQVRHSVPEAMAELDPVRPQTWISGPSATSDIELDRVEGVHGPRTLRVVLVG